MLYLALAAFTLCASKAISSGNSFAPLLLQAFPSELASDLDLPSTVETRPWAKRFSVQDHFWYNVIEEPATVNLTDDPLLNYTGFSFNNPAFTTGLPRCTTCHDQLRAAYNFPGQMFFAARLKLNNLTELELDLRRPRKIFEMAWGDTNTGQVHEYVSLVYLFAPGILQLEINTRNGPQFVSLAIFTGRQHLSDYVRDFITIGVLLSPAPALNGAGSIGSSSGYVRIFRWPDNGELAPHDPVVLEYFAAPPSAGEPGATFRIGAHPFTHSYTIGSSVVVDTEPPTDPGSFLLSGAVLLSGQNLSDVSALERVLRKVRDFRLNATAIDGASLSTASASSASRLPVALAGSCGGAGLLILVVYLVRRGHARRRLLVSKDSSTSQDTESGRYSSTLSSELYTSALSARPQSRVIPKVDPALLPALQDLDKAYYLARGYFGSVYLVHFQEKLVALKVFSNHGRASVIAADFQKELELLSLINQPKCNCTRLLGHALYEETLQPALVLELAPGLSVSDWLYPAVSLVIPSGLSSEGAIHTTWAQVVSQLDQASTSAGHVSKFAVIQVEKEVVVDTSEAGRRLLTSSYYGSILQCAAALQDPDFANVSLTVTEPVLVFKVGPLCFQTPIDVNVLLGENAHLLYAQLAGFLDELPSLSIAQRAQIAFQTMEALHWLHRPPQGSTRPVIVHGDVKPQNVLLTSDFNVRLADVGLARTLRLDDDQSYLISPPKYGPIGGTVHYKDPELSTPHPRVGEKNDIYSLGVFLTELFPPFLFPMLEEAFLETLYDVQSSCLKPFKQRADSRSVLDALRSLHGYVELGVGPIFKPVDTGEVPAVQRTILPPVDKWTDISNLSSGGSLHESRIRIGMNIGD